MRERGRVKVDRYGEKGCRTGQGAVDRALFQPLVLQARSGGMSHTTDKLIKKHTMLAGHM
jgi:hypothetical protein